MLDKIKIGWKTYDIKKVQPDTSLIHDPVTCYGQINSEDKVILLRDCNTKEEDEATLIHEVLHGIEHMYYIELGEDKVTRLAEALYTVLKDNNINLFD